MAEICEVALQPCFPQHVTKTNFISINQVLVFKQIPESLSSHLSIENSKEFVSTYIDFVQ